MRSMFLKSRIVEELAAYSFALRWLKILSDGDAQTF